MCLFFSHQGSNLFADYISPAVGTANAEIKVPSLETPELKMFHPLNLGVDQNTCVSVYISTHASPTAWNISLVLISTSPGRSPFFISKSSPRSFPYGPHSKIGHPEQSHKRFKQVPVVSFYGIELGTETCVTVLR